MTEKEIIQYLIKAFEYARQRLEAASYAICICPQVKNYIGHISGLTCSDKRLIETGFYSFFRPEKFGLKVVYYFATKYCDFMPTPIDITTITPTRYYWFPMTIGFKPDRISICNKAIIMLEENLKELNGRREQEFIEGE